MSLRLYIDHNVHAAITRGLRSRGIDCITAEEDGMARADDSDILARASQLARAIFSQDIDFVEIASKWIAEGNQFGGLIYARQMGITIGQAIQDLQLMAEILDPEEMRNQLEWIPLR